MIVAFPFVYFYQLAIGTESSICLIDPNFCGLVFVTP